MKKLIIINKIIMTFIFLPWYLLIFCLGFLTQSIINSMYNAWSDGKSLSVFKDEDNE